MWFIEYSTNLNNEAYLGFAKPPAAFEEAMRVFMPQNGKAGWVRLRLNL